MSKYEFILDESPKEDYLEDLSTNFSPPTKSYLRSNMILTSLLVGSCNIVSANDINNYQFLEQRQSCSIENVQSLDNSISFYLENLEQISGLQISKLSLIENILSFKSLNQNWDGFGAFPLEIKSCANSIALIDRVGENLFCGVKDFWPNPNGTVTFEWKNNNGEKVSAEVGNNNFTFFTTYNNMEPEFFNNLSFNEENIKLLKKAIKSL